MRGRWSCRRSTTGRSGSSNRLVAAHENAAIRITPSTAVTRWTGEALDLDLAVGWLMRNEERKKSVSAETSASVPS
jgi:hypothetical protein